MERQQKNTTFGRVVAGSIFIVFTILLMVSFYTVNNRPEDMGATESAVSNTDSVQRISIENIYKNPEEYYGQKVSFRGGIEENVGTRAVLVDSQSSGGNEVLVVSRDLLVGVGGGPGTVLYDEGDGIQVAGTIQEFRIATIQQELGVDLNKYDFAQFEGKPVVIADTISEIMTR